MLDFDRAPEILSTSLVMAALEGLIKDMPDAGSNIILWRAEGAIGVGGVLLGSDSMSSMITDLAEDLEELRKVVTWSREASWMSGSIHISMSLPDNFRSPTLTVIISPKCTVCGLGCRGAAMHVRGKGSVFVHSGLRTIAAFMGDIQVRVGIEKAKGVVGFMQIVDVGESGARISTV